jgi:hypothetical protein
MNIVVIVIINRLSIHYCRRLSYQVRAINSLLMMIQLTLAYMLMLVAMVYNGGLFAAVIVGCGIGYFLFSSQHKFDVDKVLGVKAESSEDDLLINDDLGGSCH